MSIKCLMFYVFYLFFTVKFYSFQNIEILEDGKISFSYKAKRGQFPYVVSLTKWKNGKIVNVCSGSLLTVDLVVSTCECFVTFYGNKLQYKRDPELANFKVWGGSVNLEGLNLIGEQERRIELLLISPHCTDSSFIGYDFDYSIAKLSTPFTLNIFLQPMTLNSSSIDEIRNHFNYYIQGYVCSIVGWGKSLPDFAANSPYIRDTLHYGMIRIIGHEACFNWFCTKEGEIITCPERWKYKHQFCAYHLTKQNPALSDRGSPVVCQTNVIGFFGWGVNLGVEEVKLYIPLYHILETFKRKYYIDLFN